MRVAIFPWGDVIETFLEPLGLDLHDFAATMSGGWLFGYVEALARCGVETIIIAPSNRVSTATTLSHAETGAPIIFVPGVRVPPSRPNFAAIQRWRTEPVAAFKRVLIEQKIDRILCQEYEDVRFDRLVRLGHRLNIPVFATFQGGDRTGAWVEHVMRRRSVSRAAGLIVPANDERKRVTTTYAGRLPRIAGIPNPLSSGHWYKSDRAEARNELGLRADARIAVCHGRIDIWRKGLDILVAAWGDGARRPDDMLVFIGNGPDRAKFATMIGDANPLSIFWIDRYSTDREEIRRWLNAADIYVSGSRVEGMPVAPLEAMACGLPVVATDAQGMWDIVIGGAAACGIVVPRNDVSALANAIDALLDDSMTRQRMGNAAEQRARTVFATEPVGVAIRDFLAG